jgi:hypothetical protein
MVLESNRDLVLRRMVECLGRDRTRHQVAEVTSLGLVQMTRKRIGTDLLEPRSLRALPGSGPCPAPQPVGRRRPDDSAWSPRQSWPSRDDADGGNGEVPSKDVAAMAKHEERPRAGGASRGRREGQAAPGTDVEAPLRPPRRAGPAPAAGTGGPGSGLDAVPRWPWPGSWPRGQAPAGRAGAVGRVVKRPRRPAAEAAVERRPPSEAW